MSIISGKSKHERNWFHDEAIFCYLALLSFYILRVLLPYFQTENLHETQIWLSYATIKSKTLEMDPKIYESTLESMFQMHLEVSHEKIIM